MTSLPPPLTRRTRSNPSVRTSRNSMSGDSVMEKCFQCLLVFSISLFPFTSLLPIAVQLRVSLPTVSQSSMENTLLLTKRHCSGWRKLPNALQGLHFLPLRMPIRSEDNDTHIAFSKTPLILPIHCSSSSPPRGVTGPKRAGLGTDFSPTAVS